MDYITLLAVAFVLTVGFSVKRLLRRQAAATAQEISTYHKALAVHIASTTRSTGRDL